MRYLFQLGREPHLSLAELWSVFSLWKIAYTIEYADKHYCVIDTHNPLLSVELMERLGGTIKISEAVERESSWQEAAITHLISAQPTGKIQFSVSGDIRTKEVGLEIKKTIKAAGRNVRYIEPKNTATILHNHLVEKQGDLTVFRNELFVTRAIQPIEAFAERDFGRPGSDDVSGMLPPKLAKMLINLAEVPTDTTLLDPFCGSGTILMEAAVMGYTDLLGADISEKAALDTKKNIAWLQEKMPERLNAIAIEVIPTDVRKLDKKIPHRSIDAIVTEPYLGQPLTGRETRAALEAQTQELRQLYEAAFRTFHRILKPDGVVIFVIPTFRFHNEWITIPCIPEIKNTGFTRVPFGEKNMSLLYHRPNQHVGRTIWRFRKI